MSQAYHSRRNAGEPFVPPALPFEKIHICGLIRAREVPFQTREEWEYWWLVQRNESGKIIAPARMSDKEKERYTVAEKENILVAGGITALMTYLGYGSQTLVTPQQFSQQFAVGNVVISSVETNDTSVAGEYFRAQPSLASVSGVQQDLSVFAGTTQANGTISNAGLFGNGATSTIASGTMMTHSQFSYSKTSANAAAFDYLLSYV